MRAATTLLAIAALILAARSFRMPPLSGSNCGAAGDLASRCRVSLSLAGDGPSAESDVDGGDEANDFDYQTGFVTRRKRNGGYRNIKDSRETLPFYVQLVADGTDPEYIGTYMLDHSTSNDDLLNLGEKGFYKVRKTTYIYKFKTNRLEVVKKKLDVSPADKGFYSPNSLQ